MATSRRYLPWVVSAGMLLAVLVGALLWQRAVSTPTDQQRLISDARSEGALLVYSATDEPEFKNVLTAFRADHPDIAVDYRSLGARDVYDSFRRETQANQPTADLVINSAMDLQIKLVNDRLAQPYLSPERGNLPEWAVWKNEAFAVTSEPIVIGYNRRLIPAAQLPQTHDELALALHRNPGRYKGKVGAYDPVLSPTGYLYYTQDVQIDMDNWDLISAIGQEQPKLFTSAQEMINEVSAGDLLIAYNLIGSYAFERAAHDARFGVIVPKDYVMVMSRVALIARRAAHPASAKLFLDFMLSRRGQSLLARRHMSPVRTDMLSGGGQLDFVNARPIRVGPALMANLDKLTRERFLKKWSETVSARTPH
ncbi:MAG: hypothetical protein JWR80_5462 [Bradyrhizobium sp.]|nr:hypothetical protein [Bradyrhizobium sp.]